VTDGATPANGVQPGKRSSPFLLAVALPGLLLISRGTKSLKVTVGVR